MDQTFLPSKPILKILHCINLSMYCVLIYVSMEQCCRVYHATSKMSSCKCDYYIYIFKK